MKGVFRHFQKCAKNEPLEVVDDFVGLYRGSLISQDNGAWEDNQHRLKKASNTYGRLHNTWKSNNYSLKTKIQMWREQSQVIPQ